MKTVITLFAFLTISTASSAQALTYIKSICENKASTWMERRGHTYVGDLSVSDVKELGNGKIKVTGSFQVRTSNCGTKTTRFEAELKKVLDELEITSMCRYAAYCAFGVEYDNKFVCFPD